MIKQCGIHLKVKDINRSLKFYEAFGLKPVLAYGNDKFLKNFPEELSTASEKYNGVTFDINGALLEIADGHLAVKSETFNEKLSSSKVSAMLHVEKVSEIKEICMANDFEIAADIREFHWGTKEIVVTDPDGFILVFIERIK